MLLIDWCHTRSPIRCTLRNAIRNMTMMRLENGDLNQTTLGS